MRIYQFGTLGIPNILFPGHNIDRVNGQKGAAVAAARSELYAAMEAHRPDANQEHHGGDNQMCGMNGRSSS